MRSVKKFLLALFIYPATVVAAQAQSTTDPEFAKKLESIYKNTVDLMQPATLAEMLNQGKEVYLLDTRSSEEYNVSHLKDARFADYDSFTAESVKSIPKGATVVVYCSVGYRSERVGEELIKAGYTEVHNLYGGIFEWVNQGNEVYDANGKTKKVHTYSKKWAQWVK